MTTPPSAPPARPWGRALLLLAALLLIRGAWLTWPEPPTQELARLASKYLVFAPYDTLLSGYGDTITIYHRETGIEQGRLRLDGALTSLAISPDSQWVATGTTSGTLTLWTGAPHWRAVETLPFDPPAGGERAVRAISFSTDGRSVCWVVRSDTHDWVKTISIRVWDRLTRQDRFSFTQTVKGERAPFDYGVSYLSPDGRYLLMYTRTGLALRDIAENRLVYGLATPDGFEPLVISPDQQWLASGGQGQVTIRRFSDGAVVQVLQGRQSSQYLVAFSPDSRYLAVAANTTTSGGIMVGAPVFPPMLPVTLWQVGDWRPVQTFEGHLDGARGMVYSLDGQYLMTYGSDDVARVWRVAPHNPFEPPIFLGSGLALLLVAVGRWIWQRRRPRA